MLNQGCRWMPSRQLHYVAASLEVPNVIPGRQLIWRSSPTLNDMNAACHLQTQIPATLLGP